MADCYICVALSNGYSWVDDYQGISSRRTGAYLAHLYMLASEAI